MKKFMITFMALLLAFSVASAQDLEGQMIAGGYLGYSLGFGEAFDDYEAFGVDYESSAGLSFGGQFFYGISEKFMIGGEFMFQNYSFEAGDYDDSEMKINILANALYPLTYEDEKALFLIGGLGFYDRDGMDIGLTGGIMYRMQIGENLYAYGMPRLHLVFSDPAGHLLQLAAGIQYSFGY